MNTDLQTGYWAADLPLMLREVYKILGAYPPVKPDLMLIDLVEWLLRRPDRRPREVHRSWALRNKVLRPLEIQGIANITGCLQSGADMLQFLGAATSALRQRHKEVSKSGSANGKQRWQPDWLFSDWGIHHFHLGPDLEARGKKVLRSDRVLFAYLTNTDAYLIDVLPHKRPDGGIVWAEKAILQTLCDEWPSLMEPFEMRGTLAPSALTQTTSSELHALRQAGINAPIAINGKVYIGPGMGLASDRSSTRAVKLSSEIRFELTQMHKLFRDSLEHAKAHLFVAIDASIGYFIPARNTAISLLPARTSECRVTWFFQRLLQELPIFQGRNGNEIWLPPGIHIG